MLELSSDVVSLGVPFDGGGLDGGVVHSGGRGAASAGRRPAWAGAAEQGPPQEEQAGGGPAEVQRVSELPLGRLLQQRVVEAQHDGVGRPGHGHQHQQPGRHEGRPGAHHQAGLAARVPAAVGALGAGHRQADGRHAQHHGDDDQGARRLQVRRQPQHGLVHPAVHLARALHRAVHPQTLPDHLRDDDVLPHVRRHPPHGQAAGHHHPQPARHGQDQPQDLQPRRGHAPDEDGGFSGQKASCVHGDDIRSPVEEFY